MCIFRTNSNDSVGLVKKSRCWNLRMALWNTSSIWKKNRPELNPISARTWTNNQACWAKLIYFHHVELMFNIWQEKYWLLCVGLAGQPDVDFLHCVIFDMNSFFPAFVCWKKVNKKQTSTPTESDWWSVWVRQKWPMINLLMEMTSNIISCELYTISHWIQSIWQRPTYMHTYMVDGMRKHIQLQWKLSLCFEALFVFVILLIRLGRNCNVDSSNSVKSAQSQLDLQKLSIKSLSIIQSFLVWTLQKVNFFHRRRICEEEWVWEQI